MTGTITIAIVPQHRLLVFEAKGFFDQGSVARIRREKVEALQTLGGEPTDHISLVDVSACKIQQQEVVGAFSDLLGDRRYRARRVAFVTGSSLLARMQVRRVNRRLASVQLFDDHDAARAWLLEGETIAA